MEGLRVSGFAGAEQAAEKGPFEGEIRPRVLQGLKPDIDSIGFIGTTEVVPFQNQALNRVFSQPVKPSFYSQPLAARLKSCPFKASAAIESFPHL
jgi:hypothetical protein